MPKFLTFDNRHLAPIKGIEPNDLKRAAKSACTVYLDAERKLSHNLALNHIAQRLGFKGGYGGYVTERKTKLLPFMREHGLSFRKEVLPQNLPDQCVRLTHRQVADRLFVSGLPMPKRIFAGLDLFEILRAAEADERFQVVGGVLHVMGAVQVPRDDLHRAEISESMPPANYLIWSEEGAFSPVNARLILNNLLGDQLCYMGEGTASRIVPTLYRTTREELEQAELAGRLFRHILDLCPQGWVEVIPYNERLAFLKAPDGGYDFVFKGVRDAEFQRNPYAPYLRNKDFSKSEETSEFDVWLYFSHDGWLEADRHAAEKAFYAQGSGVRDYPGQDAILKAHLTRERRYCPISRKAFLRPGYSLAKVLKKNLCFSPLVTVQSFTRFLRDNPDYVDHRATRDDLDLMELDGDFDAPAAVTWYDAKAYARWIRRTKKLPVRLATEEEWLALARGLIPETVTAEELKEAFSKRLYNFVASDGRVYEGHPPHMDRGAFDGLKLRSVPGRVMARSEAGMEVVRSAWFGEWLQPEGATINGLFGCSQSAIDFVHKARVSAEGARFWPGSAGKYKSMMMGFRLVYEAEER